MLKILYLIVILFSVSVSWASPCQKLKDKYQLPSILRPLPVDDQEILYSEMEEVFRRIGSVKIGWVESSKIAQEIRTVKICVNMSPELLVGSGTRKGSVNFTGERIIVFNHNRVIGYADTPENSLLYIHEFLGALGYPDENYQLTSVLYAHAQRNEFGRENVFQLSDLVGNSIIDVPRRTMTLAQGSDRGGTSGVGGGGDHEVALLKPLMAALVLNNPEVFGPLAGGEENLKSLAGHILTMRMETDEVVNYRRINAGIEGAFYAFDGKPFLLLSHAHWTMLRNLGDAGFQLRSDFVRDLAILAVSLWKLERE